MSAHLSGSDPIEPHPALERRYRRLLRAYPKAYRAERENEIVGTLLDGARPGQRRPGVRESSRLLLGGLRTRTGATTLTWRHLWLGAVDVAVLMMLLVTVVAGFVPFNDGTQVPVGLVCAGLAIAAMVAVLLRRYRLAFVPVLAMAAAFWYADTTYDPPPVGVDVRSLALADAALKALPVLFGLALLAVAAPRRSSPPAGAAVRIAGLGLAALPLVIIQVSWATSLRSPAVYVIALLAWPVIALLSAAVDPRLPIAVGAMIFYYFLPTIAYPALSGSLHAGVLGFLALYWGVSMIYLAVGWLTARRRIRA